MINKAAIPEGIKFLLKYEEESPLVRTIAQDLFGRHQFGLKKYGVALTPDNGRNTFQDIYEEYLDAYNYTVNALLLRGIDVAEITTVDPFWGAEPQDLESRILFELLANNIKILKTLR